MSISRGVGESCYPEFQFWPSLVDRYGEVQCLQCCAGGRGMRRVCAVLCCGTTLYVCHHSLTVVPETSKLAYSYQKQLLMVDNNANLTKYYAYYAYRKRKIRTFICFYATMRIYIYKYIYIYDIYKSAAYPIN